MGALAPAPPRLPTARAANPGPAADAARSSIPNPAAAAAAAAAAHTPWWQAAQSEVRV